MERISVIICAAGSGARAGFGKNKLLAPLHGAPAIWHTLEKFNIPEVDEVVVCASPQDLKEMTAIAAPFGYKTVEGGATRTKTVIEGLKAVTGDIVLVHDGARPYVTREIISACIDSVKKFGSGICAIKATDTNAVVELGQIVSPLERENTYRLQTPQGFFTEDLRLAYRLAGDREYTDDSAVYGEFIAPPTVCAGSEQNMKLTFKEDFAAPAAALSTAAGAAKRVGFGVDVHAFGEGNSVTLCGVEIPCEKGLIAHSDGDVAVHALMDALLSAAGLKDIGHYFPDDSEKTLNASSMKMLETVVNEVYSGGYSVLNASISIQAERPRLAKHVDKMTENIARALRIEKGDCAVAAGTAEGLGFVGQSLGIAAYCTVLLKDNTNG